MIKGVLFSSSPVRGAIELGCTTKQQNTGKFRSKQGRTPGQYAIKSFAKALRKKKKNQGGAENLLDHLLINTERQEETKSACVLRSRENSVLDKLEYVLHVYMGK